VNTASSVQYEDEIDVRHYGRFARSYWMVLAACAIAGALVSLAVSSLMPPRFQSTATLTIGQANGSTPLVLTPAAAKALLEDSNVVSETVEELGLNRDGVSVGDFIDEALDVQLLPGTSLLKLNVTLRDPTKARLAATVLAAKLVALSQHVDQEAASAARASLEKQLTDADRKLKNAEQRVLQFEGSRDTTAKTSADTHRLKFELARLQAEYDARLKNYATLALRQEEIATATARPPQLQIVAPPIQPDRPMPRRRRQVATLGGLIGLVCGIVAAVVIDGRRGAPPAMA
jgi:uncharacterized protein involved in exopolysaccharide biosynthesis